MGCFLRLKIMMFQSASIFFDKTTEIGLGNIEFIGCLGYYSFIDDRFNIFIVTVNKAPSLMT